MYTETDLEGFIDSLIAKRKKYDQKTTAKKAADYLGISDPYDEKELPEFWDGYTMAVNWYEQARIHGQKGVFPYRLFIKQAPNQTEAERQYVRANYKQTTYTVFKDMIDTYGRAYHENNYSIDYAEDEAQYKNDDDSFQKYMDQLLPVYSSIENFTFNVLPPLKMMDGMGVVAVMPFDLDTIENENGDLVINSDELVRPYPRFFHVKRLMMLNEKVAIIESDEKSWVKKGNTDVEEGLVYYIFDKTWMYKAEQYGKKSDYLFQYINYFEHGVGHVPVKMVDGSAVQINDNLLQQSPFLTVTDILDEVILDSSLLRGIKPACAYPYRIMIGDACEFQEKADGEYITCMDGNLHYAGGRIATCPSCNGTGMKDRVSPQGVMLIKPKTRLNPEGDAINPRDAMHYASPGPEMFNVLRSEINSHFLAAYDALHIKNVNKKVQGAENQTATEAAGHMKALIGGITVWTRQQFDMLEWLFDTIGKMRYGGNYKMPIIKRPTNYDFFLESDYMEQINQAIASGQPPFVIQSIVYRYLQTLYYPDVKGQKIFALISSADRLMTMASDEVNLKLSKGLINKWEAVLHDSAISFVQDLIRENPTFLDLDLTEQIDQLVNKAKEVADGISSNAPTQTAFSPQATIDRILQS